MFDLFPNEARKYEKFLYSKRDDGLGPINIGTQLVLDKDIYNLLFTSCFRSEIIELNRWKAKIKQEAFEAMIKTEKDKVEKIPKDLHLDLWKQSKE